MIIKNRIRDYYGNQDSSSILVNKEMITSIINENELKFDHDLRAYCGQRLMNPAGDQVVTEDFFEHLLNNAHCYLEMVRPQEFSNGLAKLICLSEELFLTQHKVKITMFKACQREIEECDDDKIILVQAGTQTWTLYT